MRVPGKMAGARACRLCRRDVSSCSCNGGRLRRRSVRTLWAHSDGVDHISALPEDLILKILTSLGCARAAARTSLVSKRWSKLWTRLPELVFNYTDPNLLDVALRQVIAAQVDSGSSTPLSLLKLCYSNSNYRKQPVSPGRVSSWLHAAARLHPANLIVNIYDYAEADQGSEIVILPVLDRAESVTLKLDLHCVRLTLPPADFPKLESLSLGRYAEAFDLDLGRLLPRFSALRRLSLSYRSFETIKINLPLLEELFISFWAGKRHHIDIVAPRLQKLKFESSRSLDSSWYNYKLSLVEELSCPWEICMQDSYFGWIWYKCRMMLKMSEPIGLLPHMHPSNNLSLYIDHWCLTKMWHECKSFPIANLSILNLKIKLSAHAYGAIVLHVLGVYHSVQLLKVYLLDEACNDYHCRICEAGCRCRLLKNLKNEGTSFPLLEEVELEGFGGEDHEIDLLDVISTIATNLKTVTFKLSHITPFPDGDCYRKVCSIINEHPKVKFNVYSSIGQQVLLA